MTLDTARIRALSYTELDKVTALNTADSHQRQALVDAVRDTLLEARREGGFADEADFENDAHRVANGLVPPDLHIRMEEFRTISAAWEIDVAEFAKYAEAHSHWNIPRLGDLSIQTADVLVGRALYLAYRHAVLNLLAYGQGGK